MLFLEQDSFCIQPSTLQTPATCYSFSKTLSVYSHLRYKLLLHVIPSARLFLYTAIYATNSCYMLFLQQDSFCIQPSTLQTPATCYSLSKTLSVYSHLRYKLLLHVIPSARLFLYTAIYATNSCYMLFLVQDSFCIQPSTLQTPATCCSLSKTLSVYSHLRYKLLLHVVP